MKLLNIGIMILFLSLHQTSGKPASWRNVGQCGSGLACGPECQSLCLTQHNYYRALHNLPPLRCDTDLAESAQTWTDTQAQKGQLKRSPWRNLAQVAESISWKQWGWEGMADIRAAVPSAVRSWYSEKKGSIVNRTSAPEHYQTIIRPDISRVGCGIHVIPGDGTYVTSHYATESGEKVLNDEVQSSTPRDLEPACQVTSGQREKCGSIPSPYVTPDVCIKAGCCYDDVFKDEPDVLWYSREGSTWCYKGKDTASQNHDSSGQTSTSEMSEQKPQKSADKNETSAQTSLAKQETQSINNNNETSEETSMEKTNKQEADNLDNNNKTSGQTSMGETNKQETESLNNKNETNGETAMENVNEHQTKNINSNETSEKTPMTKEQENQESMEDEGGIDCYGNSCYTFHGKGTTWTNNRQECKNKGGDLVAIETEGEWSFINQKIQGLDNKLIDRKLLNEWHVGLKKEGSEWKWVSGAPMTIDNHWQRGQPSNDGPYVVITKDYPPGTQGGFNDLADRNSRGYICETTKGANPLAPSSVTSPTIQPSSGGMTTVATTSGSTGALTSSSSASPTSGLTGAATSGSSASPTSGSTSTGAATSGSSASPTSGSTSTGAATSGSSASPTSGSTGATTSPTGGETSAEEPKGFFKDCLDQHNKLRAKHGVAPLRWSKKLAANALRVAKMNAQIGRMKHDPDNKDEGENIAYFSPPQPKCEGPKVGNCFQCREVVNDWYSEIKDYDFAKGKGKTDFSVITHFTQVVWAETTEVGMATAVDNNKLFSVARYSVKGNFGFPKDYIKNVPPLI